MARTFDRRTFVGLLAMVGAAAAAPRVPQLGGKRVVVLGAGLAGLAAAWNLQKNGYDVTVVEAQDTPGGRVKTLREPFTNGCYAEAGAVRIYNNHRWTQKYIRLMGLESKLRAYDDDKGAHLWYLQGKRFVTPTAGDWPLPGLSAREKANPFAMVEEYWGPGFRAVGDPMSPHYPNAEARAVDAFSMYDFFKQRGASDAWVAVLAAQEGDFRGLSALAVTALEGAPNDGPHTSTSGLFGGNDQLPKALAAALGNAVKYRTEVRKIAHDDDGVTVTVRDASGQHEIAADHCVCTLPFPVLRKVEIARAFSAEKMNAIEEYGLCSIARVSLQTRTRFWRDDPLGALGGLNMIGTDTAAGRIWNTSWLQPGRDPRDAAHLHVRSAGSRVRAYSAAGARRPRVAHRRAIPAAAAGAGGSQCSEGMARGSVGARRHRAAQAEPLQPRVAGGAPRRRPRPLRRRAHLGVDRLHERRARIR